MQANQTIFIDFEGKKAKNAHTHEIHVMRNFNESRNPFSPQQPLPHLLCSVLRHTRNETKQKVGRGANADIKTHTHMHERGDKFIIRERDSDVAAIRSCSQFPLSTNNTQLENKNKKTTN
jgi:hypothetical protein